MNLGDFRKLTKDLEDSVILRIVNESYEWYGDEEMVVEAWNINEKAVTFNFCNTYDC